MFSKGVHTISPLHIIMTFEKYITKCYTEFVIIGQPIITRNTIDELVKIYKNDMKSHYDTFFRIFGFHKKAGEKRNTFLKYSGYYDRLVFYNFLLMARQRNNKVMVFWAIISAGANYGRGIGELVNRRTTYLGASATTQTFLRTVKPYADSMLTNIQICLSSVNKTV